MMDRLWKGKKILLGVTAGIAAYKAALLVRQLKTKGAEVQVVMTPSASDFVTPLTLSTLSQQPVLTHFSEGSNGVWNNHVEWALWADLILIAPATLNTLSKMAYGQCDNLLMAIYFSAKCPVWVAPAMDLDMYAHPVHQEVLQRLQGHGVHLVPAESGFLASGLEGQGRMAEPERIIAAIEASFLPGPWQGKRVLITAGPTYEPIDPVRFIGNRSSGQMGFALAQAALDLGAQVILVTGPTSIQLQHPQLELIRVETAQQMMEACLQHYASMHLVIAAAAVADYRPLMVSEEKVKKQSSEWSIALAQNPDILAQMGQQKTTQFLVGFALETQNEVNHALDKLKRKNLDLIVLNSLRDSGAGFGTPTNKIQMFDAQGGQVDVPLLPKDQVAHEILAYIHRLRPEL